MSIPYHNRWSRVFLPIRLLHKSRRRPNLGLTATVRTKSSRLEHVPGGEVGEQKVTSTDRIRTSTSEITRLVAKLVVLEPDRIIDGEGNSPSPGEDVTDVQSMPYVGQATKCLAPLVGPVPLICDHSVQMALSMRFSGSVVGILRYGIPLVIFSPYPGCQRIIQHTPRLDLVPN
ncbi:hypothetical protein T09_15512 [Trichinella sp. T9]|nr:hypothetical protein T09_15512 [Trichinella sp. T9]